VKSGMKEKIRQTIPSVLEKGLWLVFLLAVSSTAFGQYPQAPTHRSDIELRVDVTQSEDDPETTSQDRSQPPPAPAGTENSSSASIGNQRSKSPQRRVLQNFLSDQKAIWTSPRHITREDSRWLIPLAAGTGVLIGTDSRSSGALANTEDQLRISRYISRFGETYSTGGIAGILFVVGQLSHNERLRETGLLGAEALVDSFVVVTGIKMATRRERPFEGDGRGRFWKGHTSFAGGGTSFPSGHSIMTWSLATVIANEYKEYKLVPITAYSLASIEAISRFTARRHFASDVFVGGVMGWFIGRYVYHTHHNRPVGSRSDLNSWRMPLVTPHYDRSTDSYGVALLWNF